MAADRIVHEFITSSSFSCGKTPAEPVCNFSGEEDTAYCGFFGQVPSLFHINQRLPHAVMFNSGC